MLTSGLALLLATAGFTTHQVVEFRHSLISRLSSLAGTLGATSAGALAFEDEAAAARILRAVEGQPYVVMACLYTPSGALLARYERASTMTCAGNVESFDGVENGTLRHLAAVDYEGDRVGSVGLVADQRELWASLGDYALIVGVPLIVALYAAWGLALFLQRLIAAPVLHLVSVAEGVMERRDYTLRAVPASHDEVGLLSRTFNSMLNQIETDAADREKAAQLKAERDKAEAANQAKSEFLARMSHEIRTPMNGVLGMSELLADTDLTERQQGFTATIRSSAEALLALINDILDFSKIESGRLELSPALFSPGEMVENVVHLLSDQAHRKGVEFVCRIDDDVPDRAFSDEGRLSQILANLVGNAVKFTADGEIVVSVRVTEQRDQVTTIRFEVRDSGIGIDTEAQARIFEWFSQADVSMTRKYGGSGLGLTIAKSLTEQMGGQIGLDSELGSGSVFWFTTRLEGSPTSNQGSIGYGTDLRGLRVLIVEDNATSRAVLDHQVRSWEMQSDTAASGEEAFTLLRAAARHEQPYDVALLDMTLSDIDGQELARIIKADPSTASVRSVLLTSIGDGRHARQDAEAPIDLRLGKPVRRRELYTSLAGLVHGTHDRRQGISAPSGTGRASAFHGHVLLVEDHPVNQFVARETLQFLGCRVEVVENGEQALAACEHATHDLILMDCQLPGIDGYEATQRIRRLEASRCSKSTRETSTAVHVPIVALTAHALSGDRLRCIAAGMDDYLRKPFTRSELSEILRQWLPTSRTLGGDNAPHGASSSGEPRVAYQQS